MATKVVETVSAGKGGRRRRVDPVTSPNRGHTNQFKGTTMTNEMTTEQLVSQLVLAAQWDEGMHEAAPVRAAAQMLGIDGSDRRLEGVTAMVAAATDMTWQERVGYAAHLLLIDEVAEVPVAA